MELGELVKRRREQRGWSQEDLARRANVSQSLIAKMEQGLRGTRLDTIVRIADALEISSQDVFDSMRRDVPKEALIPMQQQIAELMQRIEDLERRSKPTIKAVETQDDVASVRRRVAISRAADYVLAS